VTDVILRAVAYAPGSVSNLGPGFDCLGAAVAGCGDRVIAYLAGPPGVRVRSVSDARIPVDPARNTAAIAAAAVLRLAGFKGELGVELEIQKGLPLSGGLGGSAASAVAGALAAQTLICSRLSQLELCAAALEAESVVAGRHADNLAPSLLGGGVLVRSVDPLSVAHVRIAAELSLVLVTPEYGVETKRAREVLPASVSRADAVMQAAHLGALVLGLERGDADLIRGSMDDRIAEPARVPLYPGYLEAKQAALEAGALGVAVSGAGPTVLAFALEDTAAAVATALQDGYRRAGQGARAWVAGVDRRGAVAE
jgi:homoserine kinase